MCHQRLPLTESQCPTIPKILEYLIFPVHSYPLNDQASFKEGLMNNSSICAIMSMVEFCIQEDYHSKARIERIYTLYSGCLILVVLLSLGLCCFVSQKIKQNTPNTQLHMQQFSLKEI